jgi:hypothetical protein
MALEIDKWGGKVVNRKVAKLEEEALMSDMTSKPVHEVIIRRIGDMVDVKLEPDEVSKKIAIFCMMILLEVLLETVLEEQRRSVADKLIVTAELARNSGDDESYHMIRKAIVALC